MTPIPSEVPEAMCQSCQRRKATYYVAIRNGTRQKRCTPCASKTQPSGFKRSAA